MKILFVSSSSGSRGGGEIHLLYLARAVAERGHEVVLWASEHSRMDELADKFAVFGRVVRSAYENTYDRRFRTLLPAGRSSQSIAAEWMEIVPDVIHVNKQNLEDGLDLLEAAQLTGLPAVCVVHITQTARYLRARYAGLRDWQALRAFRRFAGPLVAVQDARAQDLRDFLGDTDRIRTINNGVPVFSRAELADLRMRQRAALGLQGEDVLLVAVARMIEPQKRPHLFLQIAQQVAETRPDVHFLWVGDGPYAEIWDRIVAEGGLRDRIRREPWADSVMPFLAAADGFLHTAAYEGLPLALIEAMSAGLPCLLPDDLARDLQTFPTASIVAFQDSDDLIACLEDRERLVQAAAEGRRFVEAELSLTRMAERYVSLYEEVLQQKLVTAEADA